MPRAKTGPGPWGVAVKFWMDTKNWSQTDLVEATQIQPNTISKIVRGFDTSTRLLGKIAKAFGVDIDHVLISPTVRFTDVAMEQLLSRAMAKVADELKGMEHPAVAAVRRDAALQGKLEVNAADQITSAIPLEAAKSPTRKRRSKTQKPRTKVKRFGKLSRK